ncbi:MAG: glutamate--cysteine ligase [Planctomycetes bacterium]|nr:glutamate--cysteine ligase [Planctomycetota bacterium]
MSEKPLSLFEAWGIEIEYMIVDANTLDVRSIADVALRDAAGTEEPVADVDDGAIGWSNELVNHVVELKCAAPVATLAGLAADFEGSLRRLADVLSAHDAIPLPGGMHPWMDPTRETALWPHEGREIYAAYDGMFNCRRHGWANLQSMHVNLPFADEREFARLMAAIRLVVPLVPAIAASSPIHDGRDGRRLDSRLAFYRGNATRVPAMAGEVVPEPIFEVERYRSEVLLPISAQLRALGAPPELLARDWLNARGAIARFDRMAIEIRVADAQENPRADLAVAAALTQLVRGLVEERHASLADQQAFPQQPLVQAFRRAVRHGPNAAVPPGLTRMFGVDDACRSLGELTRAALTRRFEGPAELEPSLQVILEQGTLAQRLMTALGDSFDHGDLQRVWRRLAACLRDGRPFRP